ncbi:MAG: glycosyl hydrolase family 95 catalytic domain-containing protein [Acidobacteriota bacterium]
MKPAQITLLCFVLLIGSFAGPAPAYAARPEATAASRESGFQVDVAGVVSRSDVILGRPNLAPAEAMPIGNGRLGVAVWSAEGFTAQLNRNDTLPDRLSAGQLVIPGLSVLTGAADYSGRLDLYRGEFSERGGGMSVTAYVEPKTDALIVDVSGANPDREQTAVLRLWHPRAPRAAAEGSCAFFAESWLDNKNPGFSGRAFGSLAAITALGRGVRAVVTDPLTLTVSFTPFANGHFRVIVASPHYDGTGSASQIARRELSPTPDAAHLSWWRDFWSRAAMIRITSQDGSGEYMENLRNLYLFVAAIEKGVEYPGSQAGVADMISSARDEHRWDPSAFWHWNLRMQVAANLGAGVPDLNEPYFNLYRENLTHIEDWTREHMKGLPGSCVPETMRFNGAGIEYESAWKPISIGKDCDADFKPYYNARTLSTGAEVSLWIWRQYLATNDRRFLADNYPVMASSARFLLDYQKIGRDGLLHTSPSNAHETQWDVTDPTTDISAVLSLYPATIKAAELLGKDPALVRHMEAALPKTPPLPRVLFTAPQTLLPPTAPAGSADVIAESYLPGAAQHNIENIGLEPVWPYGIVGQDSPLFPLAFQTYAHRPNKSVVDWSFDPIQAARLGLGREVASTLTATTEKFQGFANGMARWATTGQEFYIEQAGVVADALQEALVQEENDVIRIAPAIPPGWDFDGSVYVQGKTRVDVQTRQGVVTAVIIEAGATQPLKIRNPWPGQPVEVFSAGSSHASGGAGPIIEIHAIAGRSYRMTSKINGTSKFPFAVGGTRANAAKRLGPVQIGLFPRQN